MWWLLLAAKIVAFLAAVGALGIASLLFLLALFGRHQASEDQWACVRTAGAIAGVLWLGFIVLTFL